MIGKMIVRFDQWLSNPIGLPTGRPTIITRVEIWLGLRNSKAPYGQDK